MRLIAAALFIGIALAAIDVHAIECAVARESPCLPDQATLGSLRGRIATLAAKRSEMSSSLVLAENSEDPETRLKSYETYYRDRKELEEESAKLFTDIQYAYNIAPPQASGMLLKPRIGQSMEWMGGLKADWRPQISLSDDVRVAIKTKGGMHYAESNIAGIAGATMPNGEVYLGVSLLNDALQDDNPGVIAQALFHEAHHYTELITLGPSTIEESEVGAYAAVADHQDVFKLSADWAAANDAALQANRMALATGAVTVYGTTPQQEARIAASMTSDDRKEKAIAERYAEVSAEVERSRREQEEQQRREIEEFLRRRQNAAKPIPLNPSHPGDPNEGPAKIEPARPLPPGYELKLASMPDSTYIVRAVALAACSGAFPMSDDVLAYVGPGMRVDSADEKRAGLTGCALEIYDAIIALTRGEHDGQRVTARWLELQVAAWRARNTAPANPPAVQQPTGPRIPDTPSHDKPWEEYRRFRDGLRNWH